MSDRLPVLWHFTFANYSEKARWAFDFKVVAHERREPPVPGLHALWAWRVGGGRTIPVAVFGDGQVASDTTQIVATLERLNPDPPLYPQDPGERAKALELERLFTGELGHDVRRLMMDHVRRHPEFAVQMEFPGVSGVAERALSLANIPYQFGLRRYFGATAETVARAWENLDAAIGRWASELSPAGYLAGDDFSVADLTFASLLAAAVMPSGFPYPSHSGVPEVRSFLRERGVLDWLDELYARHRGEWVQAAA